jgi:hypothetical protein
VSSLPDDGYSRMIKGAHQQLADSLPSTCKHANAASRTHKSLATRRLTCQTHRRPLESEGGATFCGEDRFRAS